MRVGRGNKIGIVYDFLEKQRRQLTATDLPPTGSNNSRQLHTDKLSNPKGQ